MPARPKRNKRRRPTHISTEAIATFRQGIELRSIIRHGHALAY